MARTTARVDNDPLERIHLHIEGRVQGVGFRPFVYRIAHVCGVAGSVWNTSAGIELDIEGASSQCERFLALLHSDKPPLSSIDRVDQIQATPIGESDFRIRESDADGASTSVILPDVATCAECRDEVFDPANRRYRYPFTNCTNCGPRFSIIQQLPYDRCHTSMASFTMCAACQAEYDDPTDRRFHAQPNACPQCGPHLSLWDQAGNTVCEKHDALQQVAARIRTGEIVAVKGLGGFHLIVDAADDEAVSRLRVRKHRYEKPLALMLPSTEWINRLCEASPEERHLLESYAAPIVLLKRLVDGNDLAPSVVGSNPTLGVMLPYTPLHHLLLYELQRPVVATSANLSDEPICIDEHEAIQRLSGIADAYLIHNRPIVRHVDDSVGYIVQKKPVLIRRARGVAPLPVTWNKPLPAMLAMGAQQKNTLAITAGRRIILSQHIGDLHTLESHRAWDDARRTLQQAYPGSPSVIVHDAHPDYASSQWAERFPGRKIAVQHHHAHVLSCMAEHQLNERVLGIAWDGTGFGTDGTIWGGEWLQVSGAQYARIASLQAFPLPGGESAIHATHRIALGLLHECFGDEVFDWDDLPTRFAYSDQAFSIDKTLLTRRLNCPMMSSMGRLFDAIASIIGLRHQVAYEGQAAIELEWQASIANAKPYPFDLVQESAHESSPQTVPRFRIMLRSLLVALLSDVRSGVGKNVMASRFHATLVEMICTLAKRFPDMPVVLTGGCFQNRTLLNGAIARLRTDGIAVYWHQQIPANDGGIALGQIACAAHGLAGEETTSCV